MDFRASAILVAWYFVSLAKAGCVLPHSSSIDWSMMGGTWFEHASSVQPEATTASCHVINDMERMPYGSSMEMTTTSPSGEFVTSFKISMMSSDGSYKVVSLPDPSGNHSVNIQQILAITLRNVPLLGNLKTKNAVYITDYSHFITLGCDPEGQRSVTIFGRNRLPTASDILTERNMLVGTGNGWNDEKLRLRACFRSSATRKEPP